VNAHKTWGNAVAWAGGFSFAGYDDWRLPTGGDCSQYNCTDSEMGHLWYVELGNTGGVPMTNTGGFLNLQSYDYWSGAEYTPDPSMAWYFSTHKGFQSVSDKNWFMYAMAVHAGDVGAVPEPQTYAMLLLGLSALALRRRRPH
jgi:Protein of unknown function (DUF1566)/PEP-CTERM motif